MTYHCRSLALASLFVYTLLTSLAHADPTQAEIDEARAFLKEGREQLAAGQYVRAVPLLEKAHRIMHAPTTAIDLMKAYAGRKQLAEAWKVGDEMYRTPAKSDEPQPFKQARKEIDEAMGGLQTRVSTFVLQFADPRPANVRVFIDGAALSAEQIDKPYPVNIGKHHIRAEADEHATLEVDKEINSVIAEEIVVPIKMIPQPKPPETERFTPARVQTKAPPTPSRLSPITMPMWGIFSVSLGAAVGVGIAAGVTYEPMEDAWYGRGCGNQCASQYDSRKSALAGLSITTAVAGTISVAALGVALVNTFTPRKKPASSIYLLPAPEGAAVVGTWEAEAKHGHQNAQRWVMGREWRYPCVWVRV